MLTVELWTAAEAQDRAGAVYAVYDEVFGDAGSERSWRAGAFDRHCAREEFRLAAALDDDEGSDVAGRLVGFAYGYVGQRGQWWPDKVAAALPQVVADSWVGGHFEFVELGVLPRYRRRRIGLRLHDALLAGTEHRRALLGTDDAETPAVLLYRSRGWRKLGNLTREVAVMGRWIGSGT
jgi:ribosomal protein S18 acetylase RimI-like enzyme